MFKFVNAPPRKVPRSCERSCAISGAEFESPTMGAGGEVWGVWCAWYSWGLCLTQRFIHHHNKTRTRAHDGFFNFFKHKRKVYSPNASGTSPLRLGSRILHHTRNVSDSSQNLDHPGQTRVRQSRPVWLQSARTCGSYHESP